MNFSESHRGVSTVIGGFFFLILMISAFGGILVWMQIQSDSIDTQIEISQAYVEKSREDFSITPAISGATNDLIVNIENNGNTPLEITDIWITDLANPPSSSQLVQVLYDDRFVPPHSNINVLSSQSIQLATGTYDVKAVSLRGNIMRSELDLISNTVETTDSIIGKEIFAKPELFLSFPNPFGQSKNKDSGTFAIVVANPTGIPMTVNQVSLQVISLKNDEIIDDVTAINPISNWMEDDNIVYWSNPTSPITIPSHSASEFIVEVEPDDSTKESPLHTLSFNAYTSFGQFGKTSHTLGTAKKDTAIVNVYQSDDNLGQTKKYFLSGVQELSTQSFSIIISNSGSESINIGSYMIINVPSGFSDITSGTYTNRLALESITSLPDDSSQIKVKVIDEIDGGALEGYSFSAKAPDVTNTTLYLFSIFATGTANVSQGAQIPLGAVGETIVQVCPISGC